MASISIMPHCHDEHCDHEHEDLPGSGEQALLYSRIDRDNIRCLNEAEPESGKSVVKPWDQRLDNDKVGGDLRHRNGIRAEANLV